MWLENYSMLSKSRRCTWIKVERPPLLPLPSPPNDSSNRSQHIFFFYSVHFSSLSFEACDCTLHCDNVLVFKSHKHTDSEIVRWWRCTKYHISTWTAIEMNNICDVHVYIYWMLIANLLNFLLPSKSLIIHWHHVLKFGAKCDAPI